MAKKKKFPKDPPSLGIAIALFLGYLFFGCLFTLQIPYWNAPVERDACIREDIWFQDYRLLKQKNKVNSIAIDSTDGERFFADYTSGLEEAVSHLTPSQELTLLLHPNSRDILEITAGETCILDFEDTLSRMAGETEGFQWLGVVMFCGALYGFYHIIRNLLILIRNKNHE